MIIRPLLCGAFVYFSVVVRIVVKCLNEIVSYAVEQLPHINKDNGKPARAFLDLSRGETGDRNSSLGRE